MNTLANVWPWSSSSSTRSRPLGAESNTWYLSLGNKGARVDRLVSGEPLAGWKSQHTAPSHSLPSPPQENASVPVPCSLEELPSWGVAGQQPLYWAQC